ncbi:MAG TPA: cell division protein ZapD [Steroidobacteraceae bacterium]|nr:cell division protein ZapD [Steroidobacteraceae bacterium]
MQAPDATTTPATLDYEQPLNERMRTFLRLEFLFQQLKFHQQHADAWSTRASVASLLEILAITARGDMRTDVLKELERHMAVIHEYHAKPGADADRVHAIVGNLARLRTELNAAAVAFTQKLRDSEFLNAIKHRSAIPGGTCEFDLPDYSHWLSLPFEVRSVALTEWMATVGPLCESVVQLLWLTRQNTRPRREVATGGVFQLNLDKQVPCQLLRITLSAGNDLYPEISGSHHRCTVRFLAWKDTNVRPAQTDQDVPFLLTTCT